MSESGDDPVPTPARAVAGPASDGTESVEAYEADGLTVLYDARNPLAWIESTRTVRIDELV